MWNSDLFHEVTLQSFGPSDQRMVQQVNSVTVTTWRTSASPLMSRLSINPMTNSMNGSLISCVDLDFPDSPATTIISVVNEGIAQGKYALIIMHGLIQALIMINLTTESAQTEVNVTATRLLEATSKNITILLEWTATDTYFHSYNITVVPPAETRFNGRTSIRMTLFYSTRYNVSIVAIHPCGQRIMAVFKELYYGKWI